MILVVGVFLQFTDRCCYSAFAGVNKYDVCMCVAMRAVIGPAFVVCHLLLVWCCLCCFALTHALLAWNSDCRNTV